MALVDVCQRHRDLERDRAAGRGDKGGELNNEMVALLKEADANWQGPECAELADLAEEISSFVGWPAKKKKAQRLKLIANLRTKQG